MMNKHSCFLGLMALALVSLPVAAFAATDTLDRTALPIHVPDAPLYDELDARNATPPPRVEIKAPKGAPNVLIILLDDMGFGVPSTFGGPARMPTLDRLANEGLRFNQFHTTAL